MSHTFEECPLHDLSLTELKNVCKRYNVEVHNLTVETKYAFVKKLHVLLDETSSNRNN